MGQLNDLLKQHFDPTHAGELDITLEFDCAQDQCRVGVHDGKATFYDDLDQAPQAELTLYFRDEALALDILRGRMSPVEAFMRGDFRSSGYIVWTFVTLAAFTRAA